MNHQLIAASAAEQLKRAQEAVSYWTARANETTGEQRKEYERMVSWWAQVAENSAYLAHEFGGLV